MILFYFLIIFIIVFECSSSSFEHHNISYLFSIITHLIYHLLFIVYYCVDSNGNAVLSQMLIFRTFPWIGIYLYALLYNHRQHEKKYVIFAFICLLLLFYFIYLGSYYFWNATLFGKSFPKGLEESYYSFIAAIELINLLFFRTRTTLKYLPKYLFILQFMFLYHLNNTAYGNYNILFGFMSALSFFLISYTLLHLEIEALDWNPSFHYTPSVEKPRMLYYPLFNMSEFYDLPQFWTMFYPLYGRSQFHEEEMALVDRNYVLLNNRMSNSLNNNGNIIINMEGNIEIEMEERNHMNVNQNQENLDLRNNQNDNLQNNSNNNNVAINLNVNTNVNVQRNNEISQVEEEKENIPNNLQERLLDKRN